ncbi:MAG TPA: HDIG domain-containing protein [Chloroflexota bacterium]|nr:HDIG domain-containing protein [Chloroflexota bacterium]
MTAQSTPTRAQYWRATVMALGLAICLTLVLFISHLVIYPRLTVGDVASTTILAPRDFSFPNTSATQAAKQRAVAMVPQQFRADPHSQQQSATLAATMLQTAAQLRTGARGSAGSGATATTLVQASGGSLSIATAQRLLSLSVSDLAKVRTLVQQALAATAHQPVYPTQLPVLQAAPPFPLTLPSGTVRTVAGQVYSAYLRPNYFPDAGLTQQVRAKAAAQVQPIMVSYRSGQVIVRAGDVVDANAWAALRAGGLDGSTMSWQLLAADLLICLVVVSFLHGYLISIQSPILMRPRQLLLLDVAFLSMLLAAAFVLQNRDLLPYLFPAATLSMSLTVLLNCELSMVATALWAVLAGWYLGGSFELSTYYLVTGLVGALLVRKVRTSSQFFVAGLVVSGMGLATLLAFRLLYQSYDWIGFGTYAACALVSGGVAAALTLGSFSLLGRLFGVTTALHLLELSHPNHPLLRRLMVEAPGTYHHSIMIGTLAERAAEQINADPLLVRVSAYFHDIGKLVNPSNFAENQAGKSNIHDQLDPYESVKLIKQHIFEGVQLARHYHLPEVLIDGIWQHHGTNLVSYFYQQAVALYGEDAVRADDFRYPGPRPQARETAILMLADGVEAAVRASPGIDGDQIRAIIHRILQDRLHEGQLDECNLTLRDMALIEDSFAIVLQGLSHPRVQYPAPLPAVAANN